MAPMPGANPPGRDGFRPVPRGDTVFRFRTGDGTSTAERAAFDLDKIDTSSGIPLEEACPWPFSFPYP